MYIDIGVCSISSGGSKVFQEKSGKGPVRGWKGEEGGSIEY